MTASLERRGVLSSLATLQHLLATALVVISVARAWQQDSHRLLLVLGTVVLAGWYAAGAVRTGRHRGIDTGTAAPGPYAAGWLLVLALLWVALAVAWPDLVWVGFALWLLAAHLLPLGRAAIFSAAVLVVVVGAPVLAGRPWSAAGVIGPVVGALFALALARGQVLLARESLERARLVDSLVAAQAETAALHEELLASQREAGALAERTRLSRDIHDTLAQGFSSILLLARGADVTQKESDLRRLLGRIEHTAAANLDESRRVVGALAPTALSDSGLAASLRRLLDDLAADTGIDASLRADDAMPRLPTAIEVALLRLAQSALANVRQHAHASRVVATLAFRPGEVRLDVVDDGVGFDPARLPPTTPGQAGGGYGLVSARSRLAELGGGLEIESCPGEGTALSAYLPVAAADRATP